MDNYLPLVLQRKGQICDTVGQALLQNQIVKIQTQTVKPIHCNSAPCTSNDMETKNEQKNDRILLEQFFTKEIKELQTRYNIQF